MRGNRVELIRDPKRNLQEIKGPDGASIKLVYDDNDRIVRAEDGQGRWTRYAYDTSGFLTDVVHSDGTARYYFYENAVLTFVRDGEKRLLLHNSYYGNWLAQQQFGNGGTVQYRYDLSPDKSYALGVTLTLPDGSIKMIKTGDYVSEVYKRRR